MHNSGIRCHLAPGRDRTSGHPGSGPQRLCNPCEGTHGSTQAGSEAGALATCHLAYPVYGRGRLLRGLCGDPMTLDHRAWQEIGARAPTHVPTPTHAGSLSGSLWVLARKITHGIPQLPPSFNSL